ncbi:MAG: hypothetical protein AB1757_00565 [Acidobacteriota bacterium]
MATIKADLSLKKSLLEQVEATAREMKVSRSRLLLMALEEFIQRYQNRKLLEKINAAYEGDADESEPLQLRQMRSHRFSNSDAG